MNIKAEIVATGRRLYERGLVVSNDGNISVRAGGVVWTTPTGVSKGAMTEDMILAVDMNGEVLEGSMKPSSELKMHLEIYRTAPEVCAVVHAHPPVATSFASAGIALDKAVLQETVIQLGVVPLAPYAAPGSEELAHVCSGYCRDYNAVLLEYHGATTWGENLEQALRRMECVEYYANAMLNLRLLGIDRPMTQTQIDGLIALRPKWGVKAGGRPIGRD